MAGFIRRFGYYPGSEVITQIEGVVIVDLPPPGSINGVGVGVACVVGEFADMSYAVEVDSSGKVSTKYQPVEVYSSQDLLDKVGGFDETLGEFGKSMGNGFIEVRNKKFTRLVVLPVNLCSSYGMRVWRDLPTNKSATVATPIVPMAPVTMPAGREFKVGVQLARTCAPVSFSGNDAYHSGVDGSVTLAGAPAPFQAFLSPTGSFLTKGVQKGDLLVLGVVGAAGALGSDAGTYRVKTVTDATHLSLEKLDGSNFDWVTNAALPWRLHVAADGDTGGNNALGVDAGSRIPARALVSTIIAAAPMTPTIVPPAGSATGWNVLSGLAAQAHPTSGLIYTAAVQAPNAPDAAEIDALYSAALDALLTDALPARDVNLVVAARKGSTLTNLLKSHVLTASSRGLGRNAMVSPDLTQVALSTVIGDSAPGVGAARDERVWYAWPGVRTFIPEAVDYALKGADGLTHDDGYLDVAADGWLMAVCSNLPPERNPGQPGPPGNSVMAPVLAFQRNAPTLGMPEYTQLRAKGVAAPRMDRTVGPIFQSGITSSLTSGQKNINRRRMADYIEDSLAQRYVQFIKLPLTNELRDAVAGETYAFLNELLSPDNPPAQRINAFEIDKKNGNTPDLEAKGVYVIIVRVRTLASADFIVLQAEIGEGVTITTT